VLRLDRGRWLDAQRWSRARGACATRVLFADDPAVMRSGLRAILETHAGWEVVAV